MAWIESHQSLSKHRKTIRAAGRLSVDRHKLVGHLHELWWWALDNVGADGCLGDMDPYEIATAAEWQDNAETFVETLIDAGFIDQDSNGDLYLHDWYDYAGKLIEARETERARSRKRRAQVKKQKSGVNHKPTAGRPPDDHRTTAKQPLAPYPTVPNPTIPNQEREYAREVAASTSLSSPSSDLSAVMTHYHEQIGMLGPSQFEKLAFWVDEQGMTADVVCAAIDEALRQKVTRISYIEAIIRNWHNEGVRTLGDVQARARADPSGGYDEARAQEHLDRVLGAIGSDTSTSA